MEATEFGTYIIKEHPAWKVEMLHPKSAIFRVAKLARVFISEGPDKGVWRVEVHISDGQVNVRVTRTFPEEWGEMFSPDKFGKRLADWVWSVVLESLRLLKRISNETEEVKVDV